MTRRSEVAAGVADIDASGRTVLVTGATSGVGRETALALGRLGARVLVHGRDHDRGRRVVRRLRKYGAPEPAFLEADFQSMVAVRRLAEAVRERTDALDVLVNNAGAHFRRGRLTDDGVERTFAVNHLAPFLLTALLLPVVPADGRIVTVASEVHRRADPSSFERVRSVDGYDGFDAYARSKLANVMFSAELARRLDGRTANSLHPGFVPGSNIWRDASLQVRALTWTLSRLPSPLTSTVAETPRTGAVTPVFLAVAPDVADVTGRYFSDREPVEPAPAARDGAARERLWALSEDLVDLDAADAPGDHDND